MREQNDSVAVVFCLAWCGHPAYHAHHKANVCVSASVMGALGGHNVYTPQTPTPCNRKAHTAAVVNSCSCGALLPLSCYVSHQHCCLTHAGTTTPTAVPKGQHGATSAVGKGPSPVPAVRVLSRRSEAGSGSACVPAADPLGVYACNHLQCATTRANRLPQLVCHTRSHDMQTALASHTLLCSYCPSAHATSRLVRPPA